MYWVYGDMRPFAVIITSKLSQCHSFTLSTKQPQADSLVGMTGSMLYPHDDVNSER